MFSFFGATLAPGLDRELDLIRFEFFDSGTFTPCFTDTLGSPPVEIAISVEGVAVTPDTQCGTAEFQFIRGDGNGDGIFDVADAVFSLSAIFGGGMTPTCRDAADSNDDGVYDVADAIFAITFFFGGGTAPTAPYPGCGPDPTPDPIGCGHYPACP